MKQLLHTIDEIIKYGLTPNVDIFDKKADLEKHLVKLYALYFEINAKFDDKKYESAFEKSLFPNVIEYVSKNFKNFGWYHIVLNSENILEEPQNATGDAIDDLSDIIYDLLQVKWRQKNNSDKDALYFFKFIFEAHSQQHLLNLLNYMKNITDSE